LARLGCHFMVHPFGNAEQIVLVTNCPLILTYDRLMTILPGLVRPSENFSPPNKGQVFWRIHPSFAFRSSRFRNAFLRVAITSGHPVRAAISP
jgi:hypothetical protein